MSGNWQRTPSTSRVVLALAVALACGLLSPTPAMAGGKKLPPPPPDPPTGWEVIILHPQGTTGSRATGVSGGQQVGYVSGPGGKHASLWNGTADSWVDLRPGSWAAWSEARGVSAGQQVGVVEPSGKPYRASLWSGTPESWVDLHPAGSLYSAAHGVGDGQQAGEARVYREYYGYEEVWHWHAGLWTGTADSWVDLHPLAQAGTSSCAFGVSGGQQVGYVAGPDSEHASLWSGTASSWVDLHPRKATHSRAQDVSDGQQVGVAFLQLKKAYRWHASLWSGTAESWVDLHPEGFDFSWAYGVSRGYQAGYAQLSDGWYHAGVWRGTPGSWVDLHTCLPAEYISSFAQGIEVTDTDISIVGLAFIPAENMWRAVLWRKSLAEPLAGGSATAESLTDAPCPGDEEANADF